MLRIYLGIILGLVSSILIFGLTLARQPSIPRSLQEEATHDVVVHSASFLGGSRDDIGAAVEIAPDRSVVLGGTIIGNDFGNNPINLIAGSNKTAGGNGTIIRTNSTGTKILSVTRLGNVINDLDVDRTTGKIAVVGDFGLALLSSKADTILWSKILGMSGGANLDSRVAISNSGAVVALFNKQITVVDNSGKQLGQFTPSGTSVEDVAIDNSSDSVFVTGYSQKDGGGCKRLQVAFIRSYSYSGELKWTAYDWSREQAKNADSSCADTRGIRITIGRDNMLYFAGESAGGNNIYRYAARDISQSAPNVKFDQYNDAYNTSSNHITYYARFNPKTGSSDRGQFALARLGNDKNAKGNTIRPGAIAADENGNVYIGGISASAIADRDRPNNLKISGQSLGDYSGGDGFILVVSPEFKTRKIWTAWTGTNTTSAATTVFGVSAAKGIAAIVATAKGNMITVDPIQSHNAGGSDAFFSVLPTSP